MFVQKLRLKNGWSQEQLADFSGVSVRTIQRIEKGMPASAESLKNLGAVFNVPFQELRETDMEQIVQNQAPTFNTEEAIAMHKVRKLKGFYIHLFQYVVIIPFLAAINYFSDADYPWVIWPTLGWGMGLLFHGFSVFGKIPFLGAEWEKHQVEKFLGRKLM